MSASPVSSAKPPRPANAVERALGITDRHGWLLAWWQALVVGSVFVVVSLLGYHAPHPRHVPVAVTGPASVTRQLEQRVDATTPGAYRFRTFAGPAEAERALRHGQVYAIVVLADHPTVRYAGAQGPTSFAALVHDVVPSVGAVTRASPALFDALPLGDDDAAALPLFYICFAVVLSSYLFSITTTTQARRLRAWGHWTSAAALAVSLGLVAALVARFGTHTIAAHVTVVAAVLMLTSLATGATSYLLLRLSSTFGSTLGTVVLVILGSASGGVVPGPFLPSWLAVLRPVLPMGVSLTTIRDTVYFGGDHLWRGLGILALWAVVPLVVATVLNRTAAAGPTSSPHAGTKSDPGARGYSRAHATPVDQAAGLVEDAGGPQPPS